MMAKYFFNIDELFKNQQSIDDVIFSVEYDEQISMQQDPIKLRGPFKWDDAGTYYFEFDWSGSKIYGDRELQISFRVKQDKNYLTHWDSSNDYSKEGLTTTYAVTKKVPVYLDGKLVYGEEAPKLIPKDPGEEKPDQTPPSIQLQYKTGEVDLTKNAIRSTINIKNNGTVPVKLSDVKVRYWFTNDGSAQNTFACDYAVCGTDNIIGKCYNVNNPVTGADTYCEITFADKAGTLAAGGSTGDIPFRIEGDSNYDKTNDYSYNEKMSTLGENNKITAYIKGELKSGVEPVVIEPKVTLGDLDGSGDVNAIDLATMKRYLLGTCDLDPKAFANADLNGDKAVDAIDFALLRKALLGGGMIY